MLVDVVLGSSGEPELTELLNDLADERGLSFDVELVVGLELSQPSVGHKERIQAKDLAAEVAQLVVVALTDEQLQGTEAGLVRVHSTNAGIAVAVERGPEARVSLYDALESHDESWMATFGFRRTTYDVPAIGGGVSDVRWMKDDEQRNRPAIGHFREGTIGERVAVWRVGRIGRSMSNSWKKSRAAARSPT